MNLMKEINEADGTIDTGYALGKIAEASDKDLLSSLKQVMDFKGYTEKALAVATSDVHRQSLHGDITAAKIIIGAIANKLSEDQLAPFAKDETVQSVIAARNAGRSEAVQAQPPAASFVQGKRAV